MAKGHRLKVVNGQVVADEPKKGFVRGMVSFYGGMLSGAKNRLKKAGDAKKEERAFYESTGEEYG